MFVPHIPTAVTIVLAGVAGLACGVFGASSTKRKPSVVSTLYGELIDIKVDEQTGLSVITVKDNKGQFCYGMSRLSVSELENLYSGKGYVQIPIIPQTKD